ncbi:MAG: hypothetical protein ACTSVC_00620 [Promethearchaeota archaeon]
MTLSPDSIEFKILLSLTMFIIILKFLITLFIGNKILKKKKEEGAVAFDFLFSVFIFMGALLISRIILTIFDYALTRFDIDVYYISPNIWFWKTGVVFGALGPAALLWVLDKKVMNFKFKGIFTYIIIIISMIVLAYPVHNEWDFQVVSFLIFFAGVGALLVLFIFGYIIKNSTGQVRTTAILILFGLIIWVAGGSIVNLSIVSYFVAIYGDSVQIPIYLISTILKSIGLIMFAYGSTRLTL